MINNNILNVAEDTYRIVKQKYRGRHNKSIMQKIFLMI